MREAIMFLRHHIVEMSLFSSQTTEILQQILLLGIITSWSQMYLKPRWFLISGKAGMWPKSALCIIKGWKWLHSTNILVEILMISFNFIETLRYLWSGSNTKFTFSLRTSLLSVFHTEAHVFVLYLLVSQPSFKSCYKQTAAKVHNSPWKYWSQIYTKTYHELRSINYQLSINLGENLCRLNMFLQLALHVHYLCETQGNATNGWNVGKDISEHLDKKKKNIIKGEKVIFTAS